LSPISWLYWKWFLAVCGQIPVSQQIFVMNFDPCDNQLVLVRRQIIKKEPDEDQRQDYVSKCLFL